MRLNGRMILASASPRRSALLKGIGLDFTVSPADVDEEPKEGESPSEFTRRVAKEKTLSVFSSQGDKDGLWVIGADTTVLCQGKILNKPRSREEAKEMLAWMSGRTHKVVTSFCIMGERGKTERTETVESYVYFRKMTENEIEWYVGTEEPMDKAGAYGAQGYGTIFIDKIEGSYTNVVGLPLSQLIDALVQMKAITF